MPQHIKTDKKQAIETGRPKGLTRITSFNHKALQSFSRPFLFRGAPAKWSKNKFPLIPVKNYET
jgi:hypothetical protein